MQYGLRQGHELGDLDITHFVGGPIEHAAQSGDGIWLSMISIALGLLLLLHFFPRRDAK